MAHHWRTYLEFVHDGYNLVLEGFVGHFAASEVYLVANQDDWDLKSTKSDMINTSIHAGVTYVDTKLSEIW